MAETLDLIVRAQNQASAALNGLRGTLDQLNKDAKTIGTGLSVGVTAPFALFAKQGLTTMAEFSQSMAQIEVLSGANEEQLQRLTDTAIRLGAETSFSANEAANGMLELLKAGMDTEETLASVPGVLALAAAGGVDLATSASVTAAALNTFGLEAGQAEYVANLLAAAANNSSANISDLAMGLQQGGFAFNAAGQNVDDLAASLAILTNVGLTGSDAGTALKNALIRMISPTKEARGAMDDLGIAFFDAKGEMRPLSDIIDNLNTATAGLTEEQRLATLETIFLSDGMKGMIPLLNVGKDGFLEMKDAVNEAGAAQKLADARMRGLAGAFEYASGSVESAMLNIWQPFEATLSDLIRRGADFITWLSQLPRPVINAALAFTAVLAAAGPLLLMIPAITAFIAAMASPIGLIVLAVAGLAAAWASNFGGIRDKTAEVWSAIQPKLQKWGEAAQDLWTAIAWIFEGKGAEVDWWWDITRALGMTGEKAGEVADLLYAAGIRVSEYLDMIKAGDWGGLTKAVFSDVSDMLAKASATIAAFDWADWIDGVLDWAMYIARFLWSAYITGLKWEAYIGKILWDSFINALVWTADIVGSVDWTAFIANLAAWGDYIEELVWSTFISALTWGTEYIKSLDWKGFVATLTDWGEWIASLDWTKIITTAIDWATWIPALIWNVFVKAIDWSTFILGFLWSEYISKFSWSKFVEGVLSWGDYASEINWGEWISGALDWAAYIGEFTWNAFVSKLEWPVIAQFAWREWISKLRWPTISWFGWSDWIDSFNWPSVSWPGWSNWISGFSWPTVTWPGWSSWIPAFHWPTIPSFNWGDWINPFNWGSGGDSTNKASGTMYWRGGGVTLNERGTELIALPGRNRRAVLPRGAQIYPAEQVPLMMGGGGGNVTVYATVTNEADEERLAWKIANIIRRNS